MQIIQEQFKVLYTIKGGLVRSGASGEFENTDKETIKFPASVRISMTNVYDRFNDDTQCDDSIEFELIFKINCTSNVEAGNLTKKLKEFFKLGGEFSRAEDFPRFNSLNKNYVVTSSSDSSFWLNFVDSELKKISKAK